MRMKIELKLAAALLLLSTIQSPVSIAFAQGTAFAYQGRLSDGANLANGLYDLTFALYGTNQPGGNLIAGPLTNSATAVSSGLFTLTLDFGNEFDGTSRWLEISAQTNGGSGFTKLAPRQPLTPTPYAVFAGAAGGLTVASNQPVNGANVLRIISVYDARTASDTVNSLGGYSGNVISNAVVGCFIGGGGNRIFPNLIGANFASVLGGVGNTAIGNYFTAMGGNNNASGDNSTAMGSDTTASGYSSTAMGSLGIGGSPVRARVMLTNEQSWSTNWNRKKTEITKLQARLEQLEKLLNQTDL
jgi:Head domain of trimeric autotransporter adhesin